MATLSVKLPETTKSKLQKLAKAQGVTAHALMVSAIETALNKSDQQSRTNLSFIGRIWYPEKHGWDFYCD